MYETVLDLPRRPFAATPDTDCFFATPCTAQAIGRLQRAAVRGEGIGVLIGPHGCGKTLVARRLMDELSRGFRTALLASARIETPAALAQSILFELDLPHRGLSEHELRLRLIESLSQASRHSSRPGALALVVDEAHALTPGLLEELRWIADLSRQGLPLVRLTLAGCESLEETLARPELAAFQQRIAVRVFLEPFALEESAAYLRYRLDWAGVQSEGLFGRGAVERLHALSEGIPRRINQLADQTLLLAAHGHRVPVRPEIVDEVWSSLEQIPVGSGGGPTGRDGAAEKAVVEFGSGDGDLDWDVEGPRPDDVGSVSAALKSEADAESEPQPLGSSATASSHSAPTTQRAESASADEERVIDPVAELDARRTKPVRTFVCQDPAEVFLRRDQLTGSIVLQAADNNRTPAGAYDLAPDDERSTTDDNDLDDDQAACEIEFDSLVLPALHSPQDDEDRDSFVATDTESSPVSTAQVVPKPSYRSLFKKLRQP